MFSAVLEPIDIGPLTLKNRVVRAPHRTRFGEGAISQKLIDYHEARARGGFGLSILEIAGVHPTSPSSIDAWSDATIGGWRALADAVHLHGMRVFQQLWHGGHNVRLPRGQPPWSASNVPGYENPVPPVAMSQSMIDEIVDSFGRAAGRVKQAGLDGVEVHAGHGYLIGQFLSPTTNRRSDLYGGSLSRRMRFCQEVLSAVRETVGKDFVVGVRLSARELVPGGLSVDDMIIIADELERNFPIDYFSLTTGTYATHEKLFAPFLEDRCYQMSDSSRLKRAVSAPCLVTGRFLRLQEANDAIELGDADLVSMTRASIADPDLVVKSVAGTEPRPCIGCNVGCVAGLVEGYPMACSVNPAVGREAEEADLATRRVTSKDVLVVGGGPAGMELARVAASRGHRVTLVEARAELGGQLRLACATPGRADYRALLDWYVLELKAAGVDVVTNTRLGVRDVIGLTAEVVALAVGPSAGVGGQLADPTFAWPADGRPPVVDPWVVLSGAVAVKGHVVVVDDVGHAEGASVCDLLVSQGCTVTLVSRHETIAPLIAPTFVPTYLRRRLAGSGRFGFRPLSVVTEVVGGAVNVTSLDTSDTIAIPDVGAVVPVCYREPVSEKLVATWQQRAAVVRVVGDAVSQRFLQTAIHEGHALGLAI